jgi:hypothetical protein
VPLFTREGRRSGRQDQGRRYLVARSRMLPKVFKNNVYLLAVGNLTRADQLLHFKSVKDAQDITHASAVNEG